MIGTTNSQEIIAKANNSIIAWDNLIVWLDGTDFLNHAYSGGTYIITNENNYHTITTSTIKGTSHSVYKKPAATINRILISSSTTFPYQNFSMMAWGCKQVNNNFMNLFTIGPWGGAAMCEMRFRDGNNNQGIAYYAGSNNKTFDLGDPALNAWNHFAITYGSNTYKIYMNGTLVQTASTAHSYTNYAFWILLGCTAWNDQGGQSMATDYRCYNTVLTAAQIQSIYNAGPQHHT